MRKKINKLLLKAGYKNGCVDCKKCGFNLNCFYSTIKNKKEVIL
ncbi:MAG: hypothetical protein V1901_04210 [Patescibacteria group bacterium]